ncbi:MAG: prephenate dehydratase [Leptonema sp. (in: bacteria)]
MDIINEYRKRIDEIDKNIIQLILKRAEYAHQIGVYKKNNLLSIYNAEREKQIYENIKTYYKEYYEKNEHQKQYPLEALFYIYRELMSGMLFLEDGPSIAYLGPPGSFSHMAVQKKFGKSVTAVPYNSIRDIFRDTEIGEKVKFGVVPVDNTIGGSINNTLDEIIVSSLCIYGEILIKVSQNLLAKEKIELSKIKKIYTINIAKEQCLNWLAQNLNLSQIEFVETPSTAAASELVSKRGDGAAIGSELSAEIYNLEILARNIQDTSNNITRFWILSNSENPQIFPNSKTSIIVGVHDKPGSLYSILKPFYKAKVNLTKIESRRTKRIYGEYNFFIDFIGHKSERHIQKILKTLEKKTSFLKILGSYPFGEF